MKKTALLSVYDKTGIVKFANELVSLGWDIISSGGTANTLKEAGVAVRDVADISGLQPALGHRVVTLVPHIHGGLLALPEMLAELENLGFPWIDLVCVDIYPLKEEIGKTGATRASVIEKTDIGGPALLRSAAKGRRIVVADPADRIRVLNWLRADKPEEKQFLDALAAKAEGIVADYCLTSARHASGGAVDGFVGSEIQRCKYGENAWQTPAGLFSTGASDPLALGRFRLLQGAEPSYNNWCDVDRMLQTVTHAAAVMKSNGGRTPRIAVGVKHGNPCGIAVAENPVIAVQKMLCGDLRAIFGGLVLVNFEVDDLLAEVLLTHSMPEGQRRLLDGVVAPSFTNGATGSLRRKGDKCRLLANPALENLDRSSLDKAPRFRCVRGGFLRQPNYTFVPDFAKITRHGTHELAYATGLDLALAWAVGATSNSNTVTLVKDRMLIGNGVGQQDRVGAAQLAIARAKGAGHDPDGAVAYSDSFFPFPDGAIVLAEAGVRHILATSGSVRDKEVIAECEKRGVTLHLLPDAEARGFFGH